jgi:hypothetical protein
MTFDGPDGGDFDNVAALNTAYLSLVRRDAGVRPDPRLDPGSVCERIADLDAGQVRRLATTPILLFSLREDDERYWTRILEAPPVRDLFSLQGHRDIETLVSAALGFLWQLARRNPYSLRLISGATLYWCERIAEQTFYPLLSAVRRNGDIPAPRLADDTVFWSVLLEQGTCKREDVRHAAQFGALQAMLTRPRTDGANVVLPRAARSLRPPVCRVAGANEGRGDS